MLIDKNTLIDEIIEKLEGMKFEVLNGFDYESKSHNALLDTVITLLKQMKSNETQEECEHKLHTTKHGYKFCILCGDQVTEPSPKPIEGIEKLDINELLRQYHCDTLTEYLAIKINELVTQTNLNTTAIKNMRRDYENNQ